MRQGLDHPRVIRVQQELRPRMAFSVQTALQEPILTEAPPASRVQQDGMLVHLVLLNAYSVHVESIHMMESRVQTALWVITQAMARNACHAQLICTLLHLAPLFVCSAQQAGIHSMGSSV